VGRLRVATRASTLARLQVAAVAAALDREVTEVVVSTLGDERTVDPIHTLDPRGARGGVFVAEVQAAVLDGRADIAVHSAKDLASTTAEGLVLAAVPRRADAADALVGARLRDLAAGARVGTGSVRRRAQLAWLRPDLTFGPLRGNIETRLDRPGSYGAVVVAAAALDRLGLSARVAERLDVAVVVPQAGQGALAVECRADDGATRRLLASVDDPDARRAVTAERAFLAALGAGCDSPVAAHATVDGSTVRLRASVASPDGRVLGTTEAEGVDPEALGAEVAGRLEAVGAWVLGPGALAPAGHG